MHLCHPGCVVVLQGTCSYYLIDTYYETIIVKKIVMQIYKKFPIYILAVKKKCRIGQFLYDNGGEGESKKILPLPCIALLSNFSEKLKIRPNIS